MTKLKKKYFITIGKKLIGELSTIIINNNINFNKEIQKNLYITFPYELANYKSKKILVKKFKEIIHGIINK